MHSFKTKIPATLIFARLVIGFVVVALSLLRVQHYAEWAIVLLAVGLLTDVFDGIVARRLGISTQKLRRMDSTVDQVFYVSVAAATFIQCPEFFRANAVTLIVLLSIEALTYVVCFLKFRKEIATHSIGAKVWSLLLFATLVQIILQCDSGVLFTIFFWMGLITRLEIIAIVLVLRQWTNDVPTVYHAVQLRRNKQIKRNKLFNG
ncbi:CDP-alcohol phosphatidyltransferase family protein [Chryseolinea lacunae]|uniref:CDP-alcohol phosphatidyltransferase family protein n=1 Tax=Chryseolinea lacunae TaxID=2801331 RepID=A0ABS1KZN9_9BACT|nr:CDP-alcohol phosphatidyltransferase family protein [Chryseolinea lacunae]MBL0744743.1 CDP-alcohol phosphatidyltransferase family protein [Chryseolinea lacunae]